jgi:hypothetical protein
MVESLAKSDLLNIIAPLGLGLFVYQSSTNNTATLSLILSCRAAKIFVVNRLKHQ